MLRADFSAGTNFPLDLTLLIHTQLLIFVFCIRCVIINEICIWHLLGINFGAVLDVQIKNKNTFFGKNLHWKSIGGGDAFSPHK